MIQEFKTGKAQLCFVKVPEKTHSHKLTYHKGITRGKPYGYWHINYEFDESESYTHGGFILFYKDIGGKKNYPKEGCLALVGNPFEFTEQECRCFVQDVDHPYDYRYIDYEHHGKLYLTAKRSMQSLLDHLQIYQTNPMGKQPEFVLDYYGKSPIEFARFEKDMFDWQKLEERTGSFILLKKI